MRSFILYDGCLDRCPCRGRTPRRRLLRGADPGDGPRSQLPQGHWSDRDAHQNPGRLLRKPLETYLTFAKAIEPTVFQLVSSAAGFSISILSEEPIIFSISFRISFCTSVSPLPPDALVKAACADAIDSSAMTDINRAVTPFTDTP